MKALRANLRENPRPNYKELLHKAAALTSSLGDLLTEVDTFKDQLPEIEQYSDGLKTINIIDYLNNVETTLHSRIDGRPEPLFIGEDMWCLCYEPGYDDKALLRDRTFNMEELISVRDWLNLTIEFHNKHPKPKSQMHRRKKQTALPKKTNRVAKAKRV